MTKIEVHFKSKRMDGFIEFTNEKKLIRFCKWLRKVHTELGDLIVTFKHAS